MITILIDILLSCLLIAPITYDIILFRGMFGLLAEMKYSENDSEQKQIDRKATQHIQHLKSMGIPKDLHKITDI